MRTLAISSMGTGMDYNGVSWLINPFAVQIPVSGHLLGSAATAEAVNRLVLILLSLSVCLLAVLISVFYRRLLRTRQQYEVAAGKSTRLARILAHFPGGVVLVENGVLQVNEAVEKLTGYKASELKTAEEWFGKLYADPAGERLRYNQFKSQPYGSVMTSEIRTRSGESRWIEVGYYPEQTSEIWLVYDTTNHIVLEQNLCEQNRVLRKISFIQSHVVRKPLANILGLVEVLRDSEVNAETSLLLGSLKISAQELDGIIQDIVKRSHSGQKPENESLKACYCPGDNFEPIYAAYEKQRNGQTGSHRSG